MGADSGLLPVASVHDFDFENSGFHRPFRASERLIAQLLMGDPWAGCEDLLDQGLADWNSDCGCKSSSLSNAICEQLAKLAPFKEALTSAMSPVAVKPFEELRNSCASTAPPQTPRTSASTCGSSPRPSRFSTLHEEQENVKAENDDCDAWELEFMRRSFINEVSPPVPCSTLRSPALDGAAFQVFRTVLPATRVTTTLQPEPARLPGALACSERLQAVPIAYRAAAAPLAVGRLISVVKA